MKRVLILFMALNFGRVFGSFNDGNSVSVTLDIKAILDLTIPIDYSWGDLVIGDNISSAQTVNIKSDESFDLKIKTEPIEDTLSAYMPKKYDTSADTFYHNGNFISDTLQYKGGDISSFTDISPYYAIVLNDASSTGEEGTSTNVYFNLNAGYSDRKLDGPNQAYCIKVNYFATQTISK